jgi:hypothetical protein
VPLAVALTRWVRGAPGLAAVLVAPHRTLRTCFEQLLRAELHLRAGGSSQGGGHCCTAAAVCVTAHLRCSCNPAFACTTQDRLTALAFKHATTRVTAAPWLRDHVFVSMITGLRGSVQLCGPTAADACVRSVPCARMVLAHQAQLIRHSAHATQLMLNLAVMQATRCQTEWQAPGLLLWSSHRHASARQDGACGKARSAATSSQAEQQEEAHNR